VTNVQKAEIKRREIILPSPLAHSAAGYLIYYFARDRKPNKYPTRRTSLKLLLITIGLSLLPDIDFVPGLLIGDVGRFHNQWSHSFVSGLVVALLIAGVFYWRQRAEFWFWFLISLVSYNLHVIMDYFTLGGRGVMLWWPFSTTRYESPLFLFWGVRWSEGLFASEHLITMATELLFACLVFLIVRSGRERKRRLGNAI
jgi:membrane-bound metal-dependent hydrolase YbcI (DUF457 family)